jgi:tetraacyldisaccharide 4'-kinase
MIGWLQKQWLSFTLWHIFLLPISLVFFCISSLRKWLYQNGWLKSYRLAVPVVVVGNINVGGSGKTPLVIWLAAQLQVAGYRPGIVSRGYGGSGRDALAVFSNSDPKKVGDEPLLLARRTTCPVFVGADRVSAGKALLAAHPECNIIISDDGLQHYRLQREVEVAVVDGIAGFGNGVLLPAGPLREPVSRLAHVDAVVVNGKSRLSDILALKPIEMELQPASFYNLLDPTKVCDVTNFVGKNVLAIAGIGNPQRFFQQLHDLGLKFQSKAYADHYAFQALDFAQSADDIVVMTEKDAVKCAGFAKPGFWVLPVSADIQYDLLAVVLKKLTN